MAHTYKVSVGSYLYLFCKEWIPSSINWVFTYIWVPKPIHCGPYHSSLNHDKPYTIIWIVMRTNSTINPNLSNQAEKDQYQISSTTIWEHNILIYCILDAELNIILLYWNKHHLQSAIIEWGCCLLNENFHLILMFICFWSMQICSELNVEPVYTSAQDLPALAFKANICKRRKFIRIQRLSEFLFHIFFRSLAIDFVILIHVIGLIHQIIELGEDRDDRYW